MALTPSPRTDGWYNIPCEETGPVDSASLHTTRYSGGYEPGHPPHSCGDSATSVADYGYGGGSDNDGDYGGHRRKVGVPYNTQHMIVPVSPMMLLQGMYHCKTQDELSSINTGLNTLSLDDTVTNEHYSFSQDGYYDPYRMPFTDAPEGSSHGSAQGNQFAGSVGSKRPSHARASGKSAVGSSRGQDDDNHRDRRRDKRPRVNEEEGGTDEFPWACPYRKRNISRFNLRDHPLCWNPYSKLSTLKTHIQKCHKRPPPQATGNMSNAAREYEDGITDEETAVLISRKGPSKINTWHRVWAMLFPEDDLNYIPEANFQPPAPLELEEIMGALSAVTETDGRVNREEVYNTLGQLHSVRLLQLGPAASTSSTSPDGGQGEQTETYGEVENASASTSTKRTRSQGLRTTRAQSQRPLLPNVSTAPASFSAYSATTTGIDGIPAQVEGYQGQGSYIGYHAEFLAEDASQVPGNQNQYLE
ncbi:hypothetical protein OQA88_4261 [Cercophora sp. LCS_1]